MKSLEKLRMLLPYCIQHHGEHAAQFRESAQRAGEAEKDIREAATALLQSAMEKLGGPLPPEPA